MLEAQSVSMSIGTAIAVMPSRVKAFRRDILSVIVVLPLLSLMDPPERDCLRHSRRVWNGHCAATLNAEGATLR